MDHDSHVGEWKLEFAPAESLCPYTFTSPTVYHLNAAVGPACWAMSYNTGSGTLVEFKVRIGRKDPYQLFRPVIFKIFRAMQQGVALVLHLSLWTWLVKSL